MSLRLDLAFWVRLALTLAVGAGAVLMMSAVQGGPALPHDKLRRTAEAMAGTNTYRVDIDYQPPGGLLTFFGDVEVNQPDTFAVHISGPNGIADYLAESRSVYSRTRRAPFDNPPWSQPLWRGLVLYPALSPQFFPSTALEAIIAVYDTEELGAEQVGAHELVHYRGKVNPAYAYQRGYAMWLVKTNQAPPIKEASLGSSPPTLAWVLEHSPVLRARVDTQEEALAFFVEHPATINIWAHPKDLVPYIVQITYPPGAESVGAPGGVLRFRFRDFNHDFRLAAQPRAETLPESFAR